MISPTPTRVLFPKGSNCGCLAFGLLSMKRTVRKSELRLGGGGDKPVTKSTTLRQAPYVTETSVAWSTEPLRSSLQSWGPLSLSVPLGLGA